MSKGGIPVAGRCTTSTCCLTLPLKLEKWQEDRLAKRFELARQIYNTLVHAELKKLHRLERSAEYREVQAKLKELREANAAKGKEWQAWCAKRNKLLKEAGFTEYSFTKDMKAYYKHFNENIGSNVADHGLAPQVWKAFSDYFFGKGKSIHYKRFGEICSLRGYSSAGKSGGKEIIFHETYIEWQKLILPLKLSPKNDYEQEMLSHRVKYVRLLRKSGKRRDRWYAQLVLEGIPAIKRSKTDGSPVHPVGEGTVGIDIGPRTIAYSAANEVRLMELADQVQDIEREKCRIQRKMDRSRRAMNPENYNEDGTIKRGKKLTRNKSKRYIRLQRQLAYIQNRQAETRKRQHTALANHLIALGNRFYVEDMDWPALTHRAKQTEISEKTGRYKRKRRFGKSIAHKAPATLITILTQKCNSLGLPGVVKVSTSVRASQYNHQSDTYQKKPLNQRWNDMPDGERIQRDLYSAFLLQHITPDGKGFDRAALCRDYDRFVERHHQAITELQALPNTIASMGIVRR